MNRCATLNEELRTKFYWYREESADNAKLRDEVAAAVGNEIIRDRARSREIARDRD